MDETQRQRAGALLNERWERLGLEGLLPEEQDYLLLWELNAEVSGGTFAAYLGNEAGDRAQQTLAALERLGSPGVSGILRRVLELLPGGWCADQDERARRLSRVPDRYQQIRKLTDEYYDAVPLEEAVGERAIEQIQAAYQREGLLE
jgi:hypothetical protein